MEQTCLRVSELNNELTPHIMLITPLEKTFRVDGCVRLLSLHKSLVVRLGTP
jgi:hypothetical protein